MPHSHIRRGNSKANHSSFQRRARHKGELRCKSLTASWQHLAANLWRREELSLHILQRQFSEHRGRKFQSRGGTVAGEESDRSRSSHATIHSAPSEKRYGHRTDVPHPTARVPFVEFCYAEWTSSTFRPNA